MELSQMASVLHIWKLIAEPKSLRRRKWRRAHLAQVARAFPGLCNAESRVPSRTDFLVILLPLFLFGLGLLQGLRLRMFLAHERSPGPPNSSMKMQDLVAANWPSAYGFANGDLK